MSNEWLKNLKVGDEVGVYCIPDGRLMRIDSVFQHNEKGVYVDGSWFLRTTGIGVFADSFEIKELTPQIREEFAVMVRGGKLRIQIESSLRLGVPLEKLERMAAILDEQEMK